MNHKRREARRAVSERAATAEKEQSEARVAEMRPVAPEPDPERDVTPWLRSLGFRADEARRAAAYCNSIPDASLEDRVRLALSCLAPRCCKIAARAAS